MPYTCHRCFMERNGLESRSRDSKVGNWVGGIATFFLVSFFLVPFYLPAGTVPELSGRANSLDYANEDSWGNVQLDEHNGIGHNQSEHGTFAWSDLDFYAAFVYAFGDLNCHNKHERSWFINDNQMAVCVRDIGIFLGFAVGGFVFSRRGVNRWTIRDSMLSIFPDEWLTEIYRKNHRTRAVLAMVALAAVPMAIDGFTQMLTSYESTATMRLITGSPFGILVGLYLCAAFSARPKKFDIDASRVILPGGSRFSLTNPPEEE